MRHMNRVLVGTMLEVAAGRRRSLQDFTGLLDGRPRSEAGPTAPPSRAATWPGSVTRGAGLFPEIHSD